MHREGKTLKQIARAICSTKSSTLALLSNYIEQDWYEDFIEMNYDRMVNNFIYPKSVLKGFKRETKWIELSLESIIPTIEIGDGIQSTPDAHLK